MTSTAVLTGRLRECDRLLPRPGSFPTPDRQTVPWHEFCDPGGPWLHRCIEEWQQRGEFRHHRAGIVLVAFRFGWLACCATVPEQHLGLPGPALSGLRVAITDEGRLSGLRPDPDRAGRADEQQWWADLRAAFAPLAAALRDSGGPSTDSHEYWGNPVGSIGTVLWRLHRAGMPGDAAATARRLRATTGAEHLLDIDEQRSPWTRRRTCCQWWRKRDGGYCDECVLWSSRSRHTESPKHGR